MECCSETSKILLNDIFTELAGTGIKNNGLNLGELHVDDISTKIRYGKLRNIYQSGKSSFK